MFVIFMLFGAVWVYWEIQLYIHTYTTELKTIGLCTLFCRECVGRERMLQQNA